MPTHLRRVPWARALALTTVVLLAALVLVFVGTPVGADTLAQLDRLRYLTPESLMSCVFVLALAMLIAAAVEGRRDLRLRLAAEDALRRATDDVETRIAVSRADLLKSEQDARVEAELASRLKDDFLATISHELRTPLNAIVGWVHLLKVGIGDDRDRAVSAIERNAFAQARLIDDLLDVSRLVKGRVTLSTTTQDLRSSVQAALQTVRPAAEAKCVDVVVALEAEVLVSGDAARLQQVVGNLLSNAVKFTPKGGRVMVEVDRVGSRARLRVTDSGEGIDPALLPHVFEAFRQGGSRSARLGLGLGLAVVRQVVELHGGTVVAESEGRQQGSRFTVMMPIEAAERGASAGTAGRRAPARGLRVLVAEDDEDSATMLGAILTHRGCDVRTARNAHECLAVFDEWTPDVLVCDIGLPDDDGYSLLRRVRDRDRRARPIPAVALTAFAREEDRARALSAGFVAHVSKPFDPEALFGEIVRAVMAGAA
jgi:signal transduction histidine kinase/ActR/RegA family two-component response regulator